MTFYGVLGIKDPLRADVKQAVADCHRAGIMVRAACRAVSCVALLLAHRAGALFNVSLIVSLFCSMSSRCAW